MATNIRLFGRPALGDHRGREKCGVHVGWLLEHDTTNKQARHGLRKLADYMEARNLEFEAGDVILIEGNAPE